MRLLSFFGLGILLTFVTYSRGKTCSIKPLGHGFDDTTQVLDAISECGQNGHVIIGPGDYNITR